jgi:HAD superfamily hydrolase (TIGR01484 family)
MPAAYRERELIVFDLDGTLTKTKSDLTPDVATMLRKLLAQKKVAVIGGGTYRQFRKQLVAELDCPPELLRNLFLFPTTATAFYRYQKGWKKIYASEIPKAQKAEIRQAFRDVLKEISYVPPVKTYGKVLEDRGSQLTYSFLGQDVVAELGAKGVILKEAWTQKNTPLKLKIAKMVQKQLPNFEVRAAGFTSIDVTKKGIDKAYGIREIKKTLKIPVQKMLFVGDALYAGGNDAAARKSGIDCVAVKGPEETKQVIQKLL